MKLRWMVRRDLPEVLQIEAASFGEAAWTHDDFIRCLRQRSVIGMVVDGDASIVGYMLYDLVPGEMRLLNLAVHPDHRRVGIGQLMVDGLRARPGMSQRRRIAAAVCERNLPAQLFFRAVGFRAERILDGYYEDGQSAYRFVCPVPRRKAAESGR